MTLLLRLRLGRPILAICARKDGRANHRRGRALLGVAAGAQQGCGTQKEVLGRHWDAVTLEKLSARRMPPSISIIVMP